MFLSQLELIGFKSFAKKTRIQFHPGVTGIVGPNGCGKSNIVDAIRWVMGEQRGTALRSDKMEQVIFSGTQLRKQLGLAEVSLTIENNNSILPSEYSEVEVSRRLYRSGESEYLLNKKKTRLKDIIDLFLDTGLGADSYGLIEPTLVQRILTDSPQERRLLFEEAAGIAKYKLRVKTAGRRLEGVNDNLERLMDILSEVEKNVRSLKKQYNQAKAYEEHKKNLEEIESSLLALDRYKLLSELDEQQRRLTSLKLDLKIKEEEKESIEQKLSDVIGRQNEYDESLKQVRGEWEKYNHAALNAENRILIIDEKERNAIAERERAKESIERTEQRIVHLDEMTDSHQKNFDELEKKHSELSGEVAEYRDSFNAAHARWEDARTELRSLQEKAGEARDNTLKLEKESALKKARIESNESRRRRLEEESTANRVSLELLKKKHSEAAEKKLNSSGELTRTEAEIGRLEKKLSEYKLKISEKEENKSKKQISLEKYKSELQFLRSLIESGEDRPAGVQKILSSKPSGMVETLAGIFGVKDEYASAVEAALGEAANAIVFDTRGEGLTALDMLKSKTGGRATIIPMDQDFNPATVEKSSLKGVIDTADNLVECPARFRDLAKRILGSVLVVEDMESASVIHVSGGWKGLIVTLNGESLGEIFISGGASQAKIPVVGRTKRADKLFRDINDISEEIRALENDIASLKEENSDFEKQLDDAKKLRRELSDEVNRLTQAAASLEAQAEGTVRREENVKDESDNLMRESETSELELKELSAMAQEAERLLVKLESEVELKRGITRNLSEDADRKRDNLHQKQLQSTALQGELDKLNSEINLGKSRREEFAEEIVRLKDSIGQLSERLLQLQKDREDSRAEVESNSKARDEWKIKLTEIESQQSEVKRERERLDDSRSKSGSEIGKINIEISSLEVRSAEIRSKISSKEEAVMDKFGIDLEDIEVPSESSKSDLEAQLVKVRRKVEAIGHVNLLALEEYGVQKERMEFLNTECEDIIKSKEELLETITKTNIEARSRFNDVFEKVAKNFELLFNDLFSGGEGILSLGPGDPLESEIVLSANPAGKKLGTIDQMSGGEKTLTALALLFSLYQIKPSPFCVLDEIDAPLDDANVERYLKLIRRFTPNTQFILVTHNKLTMEACDYLYGVTMQEEGVSKIVTVQLKIDTGEVEMIDNGDTMTDDM